VGRQHESQLTYGLSSPSRCERRVVLTDVSFVNGLTASTNSEITLPNQPLYVGYGSALNLTRNPSIPSVFPSPVLNLTVAQRIDLFLSFTLSDLISNVPSTPSLLSLKTYPPATTPRPPLSATNTTSSVHPAATDHAPLHRKHQTDLHNWRAAHIR
jgi:hypothetical protein